LLLFKVSNLYLRVPLKGFSLFLNFAVFFLLIEALVLSFFVLRKALSSLFFSLTFFIFIPDFLLCILSDFFTVFSLDCTVLLVMSSLFLIPVFLLELLEFLAFFFFF